MTCVGNEMTHVSGDQTAHPHAEWRPFVLHPEGSFKCCSSETRKAVSAQDRGRPGLESAPAQRPCVTTSYVTYEATGIISKTKTKKNPRQLSPAAGSSTHPQRAET